jgi:hypothetical protein
MNRWHLRLVRPRRRAVAEYVRTLVFAGIMLSGGYSAAQESGSFAKSAAKNTLQVSSPFVDYVKAKGDMGSYVANRDDDILTLYTPGIHLAYTRRVRRHLDIGAGLAYTLLSDSLYALHNIRPTVQVSAVFPASNNKTSFSIGVDAGALLVPYKKKWKRDAKDAAFGYGWTAGAFLRYNWFINEDWGVTVGVMSKFARAYQRKRDSFDIFNYVMLDLGAVYRF